MCGPKFCSMRISQEVRDYAAARRLDEADAIAAGMREMSDRFAAAGGSLYIPVRQAAEPQAK